MTKQLTPGEKELLRIALEEIRKTSIDSSTSYLQELWNYLAASENQLIDLMTIPQIKPPSTAPGEPEVGLWLYSLNNLQNGDDVEWVIYWILIILNMPITNISSTSYTQYENTLNAGPGVIAGDGSFLSTYQYGTFDTGWDAAAKQYILYLLCEIGDQIPIIEYPYKKLQEWGIIPSMHSFVTSPNPVINVPSSHTSISIAVFGDWGAGNDNAVAVLKAMKSFNPDMYMHLGDVYYAGSSTEETSNLLRPLNGISSKMFTLNSNHEMYDGANGYFDTALANTAFAAQNGASYFAIEYGNWVLLGLDSAYFDTQNLHNLDMYMNGALMDPTTGASNPQTEFLNGLDLYGKQVVVFTHHNGISLDGTTANTTLMTQLYTLLGNRHPDYWYYGHIHDGVVYTTPAALQGLTTPSGNTPMLRCCGHAALPYGVPYFLQAAGLQGIGYFAQTSAGNTNVQLTNTIRNGFAIITFNGNTISEAFYEATLDGTAVRVWTS